VSRRAWTGAAIGGALGALALGPALARGYLLRYDLVFVPDPPMTASTLGLDGGVPRAVPVDLVVTILSHLAPGDIVEKVLLMAAFVLAGAGIARLMPGLASASVAAVAYTWNPWVAERLLIGHWAFLLGYAALPWLLEAALRVRRGDPGGWPRLCAITVLTGLAGSTPWGLTVLVVLPVLLWPGEQPRPGARGWTAWVLTCVGSAAVWAVPSLARPGGIGDDPFGFTAFAARGDSVLGVWGQLLTLGGIWNRAAVPSERTSAVVVVLALLLVLAALVGGVRALWSAYDGYGAAVVVTGGISFVLASLGATPAGVGLLTWLDGHLSAVGLLRDGQKWLAPFALLVCVCAGFAIERLRAVLPAIGPVVVAAAVVAPVLLLPGLVWGANGRLQTADYPLGWQTVRDAVAALPEGTDVASLPETFYRRFDWNGSTVVLDPLPRYLPRVVVDVDDLPLRDGVVRGEDPRGRQIADALDAGEPLAPVLRRLGISGVVVTEGQPSGPVSGLDGMTEVASGGGLRLYAVPAPVAAPPRPPGWTVVGLVVWCLTVILVLVSWAAVGARRLLASRPT